MNTNLSAQGIWERVAAHIDKNDSMLIIGVTRDHSGWLTQEGWDWIAQQERKAA